MIKKLFFSSLVLLLLSFAWHKYYVSITEAAYNTDSHTFEISIKFIGHDLEHALENAGVPEMYLGTDKEIDKADEYIKKYLDQHFQMNVDDQQLDFKFIGKEVNNDDFIYCYMESNKITSHKKITVSNTLLIEIFPEQANTVYLTVGEEKFNYSLNKEKVSDTYETKK